MGLNDYYKVGEVIQNIHTKDISVVVGYGIDKGNKEILTYFVHMTQFYIGQSFIYNDKFNINGYLEAIRDSLYNSVMDLRPNRFGYINCNNRVNYVNLDMEVYESSKDLFTAEDIKKWYLKSKMMGLESDLYLTLDSAIKELNREEESEKQRKKEERENKLRNVVFVTKNDLDIGSIYKYPESEKLAIYLGKDIDKQYIMLPITEKEFSNLDNVKTNDVRLYQAFITLLDKGVSKVRQTLLVPKVEKTNYFSIPIYQFMSSNMKLLLLKVNIKV